MLPRPAGYGSTLNLTAHAVARGRHRQTAPEVERDALLSLTLCALPVDLEPDK